MPPRRNSVAHFLFVLLLAVGLSVAIARAQDLAGEYRRGGDLFGDIASSARPGVTLVLNADHTFHAEISAYVANEQNTDIYRTIGAATGTWSNSHAALTLVPIQTSGRFDPRFTKLLIRECDRQPALLIAAEATPAARSNAAFSFLLLKERPPPNPAAAERATAIAQAKRLQTALTANDAAALRSLIGTVIQFEGLRDECVIDDQPLLMTEAGIHYRVRNNIDGTRTNAAWIAGVVRCGVLGTILAIDAQSKTVDIQPHQALMGWAR